MENPQGPGESSQVNEILMAAISQGASDVHLRAGLPPMLRIQGGFVPLKDAPRLTGDDTARVAASLMTRSQREKFLESFDLDLSYSVRGIGRFRVNVMRQRQSVGLVFRTIPGKIPNFGDLVLPEVIGRVALERRGLVLVTGTTGSGKSTTLAAMIDHINTQRGGHILTIEDPIEFVHLDKRCVITQREVGSDTRTFATALRAALRQDPDVILVGEMRDVETIEIALAAAETGHLVLSTLHTLNATETISRIVSQFPPYQQKAVRLQLASVLRAVISQRLVPRADGAGRVPCVEVLVNSARVRELIEDKDRTKEIPDALADGASTYGTQTFDQSVYRLYKQGLITYEDALAHSSNPDDLALRVSGITGSADRWS
ncbi:type IV pilus twitching motility protein PilT [Myxococcota bacterium]|nr:type IV pilus twitching motility protein PilT [Myxococcota bacterium]